MNKKILAILIASFTLSACGGGDDEQVPETGGGDGGSDRPIERPTISSPSNQNEEDMVLSGDATGSISFSLNAASKNSYNISSSNTSRDVKTVDLEISYNNSVFSKDDLELYLKNYQTFINKVETIGKEIMSAPSDLHSIIFEFEDLPANLYQDSDLMSEERLITDAFSFRLVVNKGMNLEASTLIKFDYDEKNTLPEISAEPNNDLVLSERSTRYLTIPVVDENYNDELTFEIVMDDSYGEYISVFSQNCIDDVCSLSGDGNVELTIETYQVTGDGENAEFSIRVFDGSKIGQNFDVDNFSQVNYSVFVENSESDITPTVEFEQQEYTIGESAGGTIPFVLHNSLENPDLELNFEVQLNDEGIDADLSVDREQGVINITNINVSENTSRALTATVFDGVGRYSTDVIVNFVDEVNRAPQVNITDGSSKSINESTGGTVSYTSALMNPNRNLMVTVFVDLPDSGITYDHDAENKVVSFNNIEISDDFNTQLRIVASDGVDETEDTIDLTFVNDVEPVLDLQESYTFGEEVGGSLTYNAYITNTNDRELFLDYEIVGDVPEGLAITNNTETNKFVFDTSEMSIREDFNFVINMSATDGVSEVFRSVSVSVINDIDKELARFEEEFNEWVSYADYLEGMNAEVKLFDFYREVLVLDGAVSIGILNDYEQLINDSMVEDNQAIDVIITDINNHKDAITLTSPQEEIDRAYEMLSNLIVDVENHGLEAVSFINEIANLNTNTVNLDTFDETKNFLSDNGVYGRYVGNSSYGSYLENEKINWNFIQAYKMLDLVNPNKCN